VFIVFYIFSVIISFVLNFCSMNFYKKIINFNNSRNFIPEVIYQYFLLNKIEKIIVIFTLIIFGITPYYNLFYSLTEFDICYRSYKKNEKECANRIMNKLLGDEEPHLQFKLSPKFIKSFNSKVDWSKLK